jgi:eukaryotic-like serine/threonine-protein kinase
MTHEELFLAALDIADEKSRLEYLDQVCADNPVLRREVLELLASHGQSGDFLDVPVAEQMQWTSRHGQSEASLPSTDPNELVGALLGNKYKLMEMIGEGGMGTVFRAEQLAPIVRTVAVKVVKAGMDSKAVLTRFEAERQALAIMDHPNIAKVFDAGTTPSGRPYFVMELVNGVPITKFCDERKLTPRQRLELFIPICQAIQHAHQKGIIHRDIKPSNVLVTLYDELPVPKVIDFGVAKALVGPLITDSTMLTGIGTVVGTPEYMSPEQASLTNPDVDTRTDVFSMGVLLYELLTGSTPLDRKRLHQVGSLEMLRIVCEVETPKPSTKLSTLGNLPNIAANRGMDPVHLSRLLKGELEWVMLKAIDKDRARRYESAIAFSRDIQRYLADELVEAQPPSRLYQLKKFVRRHSGSVVATSLVLLALVLGMLGTIWQLIRAENALRAEANQRQLAEDNERKAREATELTQSRLKQIETINNTVFDIFSEFDIRKVRESSNPVEYVLAEKLIAAGKDLDNRSIQDPLVLSSLQNRLGKTLISLGHADDAIPFLKSALAIRERSLGADHIGTFTVLNNLSLAYSDSGLLENALQNAQEADKRIRLTLSLDHPERVTSMNNLALAYKAAGKLETALPMFEQILALIRTNHEADHPATLTAMNNLALAYSKAGKLDKAIPLLEETLKLTKAKLGPDHPRTLLSRSNFAGAFMDADKPKLAIPLYEETLAQMKMKLGNDHPDTLSVMNNLAMAYKEVGKYDQALLLFEETLKLRKVKLGANHPATLTSMNNLATTLLKAKKGEQATILFEETLSLKVAKLGQDHPSTILSISNLAKAYEAIGNLDKAITFYYRSYSLRKVAHGHDHASTQAARNNLIQAYDAVRRFDQSELLYREELAIIQRKSGRDSSAYGNASRRLAENLSAQKKWIESEPFFRECLAISEQKQPDSFSTANTRSLLGNALMKQKRYAEAEPLLLKGYDGMKASKATSARAQVLLASTVDRLIELYDATNKLDELKRWKAERAKYLERAPQPRKLK